MSLVKQPAQCKRHSKLQKLAAYTPHVERKIGAQNRVILKALKKLPTTAALLAALTAGQVHADSTCRTEIHITIGGQAALHQIPNTITRHGVTISSDSRHTYVTELNCGGGYLLTVTDSHGNKREKPFNAGITVQLEIGG